jgi:hypothetical protein
MKISVPGKSRTGKLAPSTPGHKTKVLAISGAVLLAASTFAAASPAPAAGPGPCAGIDLSTPTASGCTIESGEGNSFLIRSGNGGDGADSGSAFGGIGDLGVLATGTYTNTSGGQETLIFVLGGNGTDSTGSNDATIGADSYINVNGSRTYIIELAGGGAGTDASGSTPGVAGSNGIVLSGSLPSGWTAVATGGTPRLTFTAAGASGLSESSGPAPLLQQFGKSASATCESSDPDWANWPGVIAGGWTESWAQWVNDGNGGVVCTRTLVRGSDGMWSAS